MSDSVKRTKSSGKKPGKGSGSTKRLNRSQRRALQVRSAESVAAASTAAGAASAIGAGTPAASARTGPTRRLAHPLASALPRSVEYAYIRADLRRLAITATALLALMLVLLFIVD